MNYIIFKSTDGKPHWFNILFVNELDSDIINFSNVKQVIQYKVDSLNTEDSFDLSDDSWTTGFTYYNSGNYKITLYGYAFALKNYTAISNFEPNQSNFAANNYFTVTYENKIEQDLVNGSSTIDGFNGNEAHVTEEFDAMSASSLLKIINNLRSEISIWKNNLSTDVYNNDINDESWHGGEALDEYIDNCGYIQEHQSLEEYVKHTYIANEYATYVDTKINNILDNSDFIHNDELINKLNYYPTYTYTDSKYAAITAQESLLNDFNEFKDDITLQLDNNDVTNLGITQRITNLEDSVIRNEVLQDYYTKEEISGEENGILKDYVTTTALNSILSENGGNNSGNINTSDYVTHTHAGVTYTTYTYIETYYPTYTYIETYYPTYTYLEERIERIPGGGSISNGEIIIATINDAGIVKPDGNTIKIDNTGKISVDIDKLPLIDYNNRTNGIVAIPDGTNINNLPITFTNGILNLNKEVLVASSEELGLVKLSNNTAESGIKRDSNGIILLDNNYFADYIKDANYNTLISSYISKTELSEQSYITENYLNIQSYVKKTDEDYTNLVNSYVSKEFLTEQTYITKQYLETLGYLTETDVRGIIGENSSGGNSGNNIDWTASAEYQALIDEIHTYATQDYVDNNFTKTTNLQSILNLSTYATKDDINNVYTLLKSTYVTYAFLSDQTYITEGNLESTLRNQIPGLFTTNNGGMSEQDIRGIVTSQIGDSMGEYTRNSDLVQTLNNYYTVSNNQDAADGSTPTIQLNGITRTKPIDKLIQYYLSNFNQEYIVKYTYSKAATYNVCEYFENKINDYTYENFPSYSYLWGYITYRENNNDFRPECAPAATKSYVMTYVNVNLSKGEYNPSNINGELAAANSGQLNIASTHWVGSYVASYINQYSDDNYESNDNETTNRKLAKESWVSTYISTKADPQYENGDLNDANKYRLATLNWVGSYVNAYIDTYSDNEYPNTNNNEELGNSKLATLNWVSTYISTKANKEYENNDLLNTNKYGLATLNWVGSYTYSYITDYASNSNDNASLITSGNKHKLARLDWVQSYTNTYVNTYIREYATDGLYSNNINNYGNIKDLARVDWVQSYTQTYLALNTQSRYTNTDTNSGNEALGKIPTINWVGSYIYQKYNDVASSLVENKMNNYVTHVHAAGTYATINNTYTKAEIDDKFTTFATNYYTQGQTTNAIQNYTYSKTEINNKLGGKVDNGTLTTVSADLTNLINAKVEKAILNSSVIAKINEIIDYINGVKTIPANPPIDPITPLTV